MFEVALVNQKGGVGKTTNTINIAGALASKDHDVLVVDFDPQGYLSHTLGLKDQYQNPSTTLADALFDPSRTDSRSILHECPEFDVVPSDGSLRRVIRRLTRDETRRFGLLGRFFDSLTDRGYDFVVVDTPPVQNEFTDLILGDCRDFLIPMAASNPSIHSTSSMLNRLIDLEQNTDASPVLQGVLVSDVNYPLDNEQQRAIDWIEDYFGGLCPVYVIRHRADIQRSLNNHESIFGPNAEQTDMTDVYLDIATKLEDLCPETEP